MEYKTYKIVKLIVGCRITDGKMCSRRYENKNDAMEAIDLNNIVWLKPVESEKVD